MVFSRKEPIQKVLDTCRGKLHIKKKAKGAALLEGEEVCSWCVKSTMRPRVLALWAGYRRLGGFARFVRDGRCLTQGTTARVLIARVKVAPPLHEHAGAFDVRA